MNTPDIFQKWVWTELIGFDAEQPDFGVRAYLDDAGFTPQVVCLLLCSPDPVLSYRPLPDDTVLPAEVCAREGREHSQQRKRQTWTTGRLRGLLRELHRQDVAVYLSFFTHYFQNRTHHEWISDHPESQQLLSDGRRGNLNVLATLEDGALLEDQFIPRLAAFLKDYGFDGWHGADGYGPLSGPIFLLDCSDSTITQYQSHSGLALPDEMAGPCGEDASKLKPRLAWIWRHQRAAWIDFWADRWAGFWGKVMIALHAQGLRAVINSAWTRDPFEALYRYGIDYRRIVEAGVDGIVVESVAGSMSLISGDKYHEDYLAMIMLLKAYVPQTPLIGLFPVQDAVEQWDLLRHAPTVMERELFAMANVFHADQTGYRRCLDGYLYCLADAIEREKWRVLREHTELAASTRPRRAPGAVVVWSDELLGKQVETFTASRCWHAHHVLTKLMECNASIQTAARIEDLDHITGAILVPHAQWLSPEQRRVVLAYGGGPVICVGLDDGNLPPAAARLRDPASPFECRVYHGTHEFPAVEARPLESRPDDIMGIIDPTTFHQPLVMWGASEAFMAACAQAINAQSHGVRLARGQEARFHGTGREPVTLMLVEQSDDTLRVALRNQALTYACPQVDLGRPILAVKIISPFPLKVIKPEGSKFTVMVPPRGITVVDVTFAT